MKDKKLTQIMDNDEILFGNEPMSITKLIESLQEAKALGAEAVYISKHFVDGDISKISMFPIRFRVETEDQYALRRFLETTENDIMKKHRWEQYKELKKEFVESF